MRAKGIDGKGAAGTASSQGICPKGHVLPHKKNGRRCSVLFCGGEVGGESQEGSADSALPHEPLRKERRASVPIGSTANDKDIAVLTRAEERYQTRKKILGTPDLRGQAALTWAEDEISSLVPDAIHVVKQQLRYGDDKQQGEMALHVLGMNGLTKRDAANTAPPVVILQMGSIPWSTQDQVKVVDGKAFISQAQLPVQKKSTPDSSGSGA